MDLSKTKKALRPRWMVFLLLMVFLFTGAGKALAQQLPFPIGSETPFTPESKTYVFTPEKDGTLSMTGFFDSQKEVWSTKLSSTGKPTSPFMKPTVLPGGSLSTGYTYTWEMEANKTYYFSGYNNYGYTYTDITYTPAGGDVPEPTITPDPATVGIGDDFPTEVHVEWGGATLSLNGSYSLPVMLNGQPAPDPWGSNETQVASLSVVEEVQESWGSYWDTVEEGTNLMVSIPWLNREPEQGDVLSVTIPAGAVNVGNGTNDELVISYTFGDSRYDDSVVKTLGSTVTFDGPGSCQFKTRLGDMSDMCVVSNSTENLGAFISMVYKVDPNNPKYDRAYTFDVVKQDDGTYAYNFNQVTYNECVFTYTGTTPVTFTFQQEWADGQQEGGLTKKGEFVWGQQFTINPNEVWTYTFNENYSSQSYIMLTSNNNVLQNGTLKVLNSGDYPITEAWKTKSGNTAYDFIAAENGTYGYTGSWNFSAPYTMYVQYTGNTPIEITFGEGEFTEKGVAVYLPDAEVSPLHFTTLDSKAVITLTWPEDMTVRDASQSILGFLNDDIDPLMFEIRQFAQFTEPDGSTTPDGDEIKETLKNGDSGNPLYFLFGNAVKGDLQLGTYRFILPPGILQDANGNLNGQQEFTVEVTDPTFNYVLNGAIFQDPAASHVMTLGDDNILTLENVTVVPQTFNIQKLYKTEVIETYKAVTEENFANQIFNLGSPYQATTEGGYDWILTAATTPAGTIANFSFNLSTLELTVSKVAVPELPEWQSNPSPKEELFSFMGDVFITWDLHTLKLQNANGINATFNGQPLTVINAYINDHSSEGIEGVPGSNKVTPDAVLQIFLDVDPMDVMTEGTYVITIPANTVLVEVDGTWLPNNEITLTYYVGEAPEYKFPEEEPTVTPEPGVVKAEDLQTVKISYEGYDIIKVNSNQVEDAENLDITLSINGGEAKVLSYDYEGEESTLAGGYYPYLLLNVNAEEPGEYVITIPAGAISVLGATIDEYGSVSNPEPITLTYTIEGAPAEPLNIVEIDPVDGSIEIGLGIIYVNFDAPVYVDGKLANSNKMLPQYTNIPLDKSGVVVTLNGQQQTLGMGSYLRALNNTGTTNNDTEEYSIGQLQLSLGDMAMWWPKGNIQITIPSGLVTNEAGGTYETINLSYTTVNQVDEETKVTFSPADNAIITEGEDAQVMINWTGYNAVGLLENPVAYIYASQNVSVAPADLTPNEEGRINMSEYCSFVDGSLVIDLSELEAAQYELVIPQCTVKFEDDYTNTEVYYNFTIEEYVPAKNAIYFADFPMEFTMNSTEEVTVTVPIRLDVDPAFDYMGFQFDIKLPSELELEVASATLSEELSGMQVDGSLIPARVEKQKSGAYRVLATNESTNWVGEIAILTISGKYVEGMETGSYPVSISDASVIFSSDKGQDITEVNGWNGFVNITVKKELASNVTIESCRLLWPSYTSREGANEITDITEGQSVELTAELTSANAGDVLVWSATVDNEPIDGITVTTNGGQNLTAVVTTNWEELQLDEDIDVVVRAQAETEDVYAEYTLTVKPIVLGDANDNDEVNVADVVTTANYIANGDNEATIAEFVTVFDHPNADVVITDYEAPGNVNGITVSDVTAIVNIALGVQDVRNVRRHVSTYRSNDRLVAARVSDNNIAVALDGQTAYAALQVEIEMPAGMSVYGIEKGARAAAHELTYGVNANGNVVVVLYSLDNGTFAAGEGSLFTLQVEGGNAEDMRLVNAFASDAQSNGYELEGVYSSEVTGIFGIEAELASGVRYYTVDGVQVTNPEKGQILIRVQNGQSTKMIVK